MKQVTYLIIGFMLILSNSIYSQSDSPSNLGEQYYKMGEFFRWGHGSDSIKHFDKAVVAYQHSADLGFPDGIMALGEMYLRGKGGLDLDEQLAFELFKKAYDLGSGRACYNLGMACFYGQGCEVDYGKMFEYMNEGIARNDHSSMYGLGEMYFKGWGVLQSYFKAVELFEQSAQLGNSASKYYLGICYRNGYGVKKDVQKAKTYLEQATRMCFPARTELKMNEGEVERSKKIKKVEYDAPEKYMKVNNSASLDQFEGRWLGHLTIYDWSGQFKLDQEEVELNIELEGEMFVGSGTLNGEPIEISGFNNQFGIEFSSGQFLYNNHYFGEQNLRIETGSFETYKHGSKDILAGSIGLSSIDKNCPERPAYLVLTKDVQKLKSVEIEEPVVLVEEEEMEQPGDEAIVTTNMEENQQNDKNSNQKEQLSLLDKLTQSSLDTRVWPVPFSNSIHVEYHLELNSKVLVRLVSIDGKKVYQLSNQEKPAGLQHEQFPTNVTRGVYLLQVITENQKSTTRIVKN